MEGMLKRPILTVGLGLAGVLWLANGFSHAMSEVGNLGVWSLAALGAGAWWLGRQSPQPVVEEIPETFDRAEVDRALNRVRAVLSQLATETESGDATLESLQNRLAQLESLDLQRPLTVAVAGRKAVGKTALCEAIAGQSGLEFRELPPCFDRDTPDPVPAAQQADVVLFLVDGDITEPELDWVRQLRESGQTLLVAWNQSDRCLPEERAAVLSRIRQRVAPYVTSDRVIAIAAAPSPIEVRQYQADNSVRTSTAKPEPDLEHIQPVLSSLNGDRATLIYATTYRQAGMLRRDTRDYLNQLRRDRALPVVRRYQWIAATAAFANPLPSLDLLATGATTTQLAIDLSKIYQQKFSAEQAKAIAGALGGVMVNLGLVELSTQLITAGLKHNPITFVAGGAAEGLSAAYLTHIAGLSLIEYFEQQESFVTSDGEVQPDGERLSAIVKGVLEANRRTAFVDSLIRQASDRFATKPAA
jgi:hypothetical protein